jgi:hypothetical protein
MDRQSRTRNLSSPNQIGLELPTPRRIPLEFTLDDVRKLKSESHALMFSVRCSGYEPKEIPLLFEIDAGQWSNILSGKKHFPHERRNEFMDFVGNEILLMYACESRGYDFSTLRKQQTELERELERVKAENDQLKHDREVERAAFASIMSGRK